MPVGVLRPIEGAAVALAREPGEAADLLAVHTALRLAEVAACRAAAAILGAEALAAAMVRTAQAAALKREEPVAANDRLPITRVATTTFDNDAQPGGRSAQTRNAGAVYSIRGEDPCAS